MSDGQTTDFVREVYAAMRGRNPRHDVQSGRDEFDAWLASVVAAARAEERDRITAAFSCSGHGFWTEGCFHCQARQTIAASGDKPPVLHGKAADDE